MKKSHILRPSHILKPSHAGQFMPRARRQVTYETPHLQGAVRSASPTELEEITSEEAILKLSHILKPSHARQFIPRARRQITYETLHLQGPVRSASPAEPEENTSEEAILKPSHILRPSHILKPSHAGQFMPRARRQVTYETPYLQGPVRSASPAEPEENTSEEAILKPSHFLKPSHASEAVIASNTGRTTFVDENWALP